MLSGSVGVNSFNLCCHVVCLHVNRDGYMSVFDDNEVIDDI